MNTKDDVGMSRREFLWTSTRLGGTALIAAFLNACARAGLVTPTTESFATTKAAPGTTVEPTATLTPQSGLPLVQPTVEPTVEPTPTATATPTPTPRPTATPTPVPPAGPTPTAQAQAPFQPAPASLVMNYRVSDAPQGAAVTVFPAGTSTVFLVFDFVDMPGEEVRMKVYDNVGNVLCHELRTLTGDGTVSIGFSVGEGGFPAGRYLVNLYKDRGVIRTAIWDVSET